MNIDFYVGIASKYKGLRDMYKLNIDFDYFNEVIRPKVLSKESVKSKKPGDDLTTEFMEVLEELGLKDKLKFVTRTEDFKKVADSLGATPDDKVLRIDGI